MSDEQTPEAIDPTQFVNIDGGTLAEEHARQAEQAEAERLAAIESELDWHRTQIALRHPLSRSQDFSHGGVRSVAFNYLVIGLVEQIEAVGLGEVLACICASVERLRDWQLERVSADDAARYQAELDVWRSIGTSRPPGPYYGNVRLPGPHGLPVVASYGSLTVLAALEDALSQIEDRPQSFGAATRLALIRACDILVHQDIRAAVLAAHPTQ